MSKATQQSFAERLKTLREAAGFTGYRLAQLSGVSPQHILRLERGEQQPSLDVARKLATALGRSLSCWD